MAARWLRVTLVDADLGGDPVTDQDDAHALASVLEGFIPRPPPITTPAERRRWNLCLKIATTCSECCEESGVADPMFVAFAARGLYDSDIPTDDPADAPTAD